MKYEQIVNKIIFILFYRTLYRSSIYRTAIYDSKLDNPKCQVILLDIHIAALCQVILLDKISYNQVAKMQKIQVIVIFSPYPLAWGIFYIIKHLFDCETRAMCSTHTSRPKSHITLPSPLTS